MPCNIFPLACHQPLGRQCRGWLCCLSAWTILASSSWCTDFAGVCSPWCSSVGPGWGMQSSLWELWFEQWWQCSLKAKSTNPCFHPNWAVLGGWGPWTCWLSLLLLQFPGTERGFEGFPRLQTCSMAEIKDSGTQTHCTCKSRVFSQRFKAGALSHSLHAGGFQVLCG